MNCGPFVIDARHFSRGRGWAGFGFDPSMFGDFWGAGRGPGGGHRRGRAFDQGDLKYVILKLLDEKPRHGYDIIKELEDRTSGTYAPSPGTVYPTLTLLEDMGFAKATPEDGGRKIYEITDAGRAHLAEHRGTVDDLFERISQFGAGLFSDSMAELVNAFKNIGRATFKTSGGRMALDPERAKRVREILDRAAKEIDALST